MKTSSFLWFDQHQWKQKVSFLKILGPVFCSGGRAVWGVGVGEADKYILCMTIDQSYLPTHLPMYPLPPSLKTECFRSWLPTQMCGLDKYIFPTEEYTISIFESFSPPEGSRWTSVKTLTQLFLKMPTPIDQHIHCINRTAFIRAL